MNILVTGANGQLGTEIRKRVEFLGNGQPNHNVGEPNYYIFAGRDDLDITDEQAIRKYVHDNSINVIVNCAAYTAVDKAEDDEATAYKINAIGARNLANAVKTNGGVLIHISTDYVFDGAKNEPYKPDDPTNPQTVYGRTKLKGEKFIQASGCAYIILRTSWLYGGDRKNFVKTMFDLIQTKETFKVVVDQIGSPTYCFDLAEFIYHIIEENNDQTRYLSKWGTYHFCNTGETSWYGLTKGIKTFMDYFDENYPCEIMPCTTEEYPTRAQRPKYSVMDTSLTVETFDYDIRPWAFALEDCIDLYLEE